MIKSNHSKNRYLKASKYKDIIIISKADNIYINRKKEPKFIYDIKDISVDLKIDENNIGNTFISICGMQGLLENDLYLILATTKTSSYFTIEQDGSNIPVLADKFRKLNKLLRESYRFGKLYFENSSCLNYIEYSADNNSYNINVGTRSDFKDFDVLEKYDLQVFKKDYPRFKGKIICDGKFIKTENSILKFNKELPIDKFAIDLNKEINIFEFSFDDEQLEEAEFTINYLTRKGKYRVYFIPSKIEDFKYLKLVDKIELSDVDHCDYTVSDILSYIYNI